MTFRVPSGGGGGAGTVTGPGSSTDNAVVRWDGATGTIIQNSGSILTDDDNIYVNNYIAEGVKTASAGGTTVLTAASQRYQLLDGTLNQTYQLPNATTLSLGPWFVFSNGSTGSLIITDAGSNTIYTVPSGGTVQGGPTDIGSANGSWDFRPQPPTTISWSSTSAGLIFNTALTTTAQIISSAASATAPVFIPYRSAGTTGYSGDGTNLIGVVSGATSFTSSATAFNIPTGSTYRINSVTVASTNTQVAVINFIIDGGGATITSGLKGDFRIPFACTITEATLLADQSGSIVVDIWKDTLANYPPTVADTITASAKPTLSSATNSTDTTLTGWTTSVAAGDTFRINVDSIATCQRVTLMLKLVKT